MSFESKLEHWSSPNGCHENCPACEDEAYQNRLVECDNCGRSFEIHKCKSIGEIPHLAERLDEGAEVPAGECPDPRCGALVYLVEKPEYMQPTRDQLLHNLYCVEHFWAGDDMEPSVYMVRCARKPTKKEVIKACEIDFAKGERIEITKYDLTGAPIIL